MKVTQTVVRTTHATQQITVEVPDGSTDEQVRQALLEKAANTEFVFGKDADYQLYSEIGESDGERAKADVRWILGVAPIHRTVCGSRLMSSASMIPASIF